MPPRTHRHLELLRLGPTLKRYADRLDTDANASSFLVHQALSSAFAEQPSRRQSLTLETSLRDDIDRNFAELALRSPMNCSVCAV